LERKSPDEEVYKSLAKELKSYKMADLPIAKDRRKANENKRSCDEKA
jgi:hypothetical protein